MSRESGSSEPDRKRLARSHDHKLGGVAGGVADYFDIDPTIVRVLWVAALFIGPLGFAAAASYILLWIVLPKPEGAPPPATTTGGADPTLVLGVILIAIGLLFFVRSSWLWMPGIAWAGFTVFWPLVLVLVGVFVIYSSQQRR